ncbi:undecaprenyl-phosphate glucose phosphotransferase [Pontibacter sp. E15-1]|uniref:undecaprenyl-phosphate glucose phosphotransferase n=1 Tax=Pontibacter sp. E15-1 TaxID=2919918 RepID=UPI001F501F02|nr:undecaprenyl-phosphate glucose phosphotransferase [Pontibacter sp. E15-1]MCJ8166395.1 undecaprenyl-phosphate glucose phosphotransferase [Pontibacter sp. E15-1]
MPRLYSKYIKLVHATGDIIAIALSSVLSFHIIRTEEANNISIQHGSFMLFAWLAWFICATLVSTYRLYRVTPTAKALINALKAITLYVILIEATISVLHVTVISKSFRFNHYAILLVLVLCWRLIVITVLKLYRARGYNYRNVIIVGYSKSGKELKKFFKRHPELGYRFLGFFDDNANSDSDIKGTIESVEDYALQYGVDEIYCSPFELKKFQLTQLINFVDNNLIRIKFLPDPGSLPYKNLKIDFYDLLPVLILRTIPLDDAINKFFKRVFDFLFALLIIVSVLSWMLPLLAILIKIDSEGPVFFKQERSGIDNKKFKCWKLRTMYANKDANTQQARRGDARITLIGGFLRRSSLDELPQFFNVLFGQMSVVGPRPHMLKHTQEYAAIIDKFMVRHLIKPGITGLSQIRGFRGDTSEVYQMRGRVKLDIFYLENWSFLLDLKIIFYTVYNIMRGDKAAF